MNRKINGKTYIYPWLSRCIWRPYFAKKRGILFSSPLLMVARRIAYIDGDGVYHFSGLSIGLCAHWRIEDGGIIYKWSFDFGSHRPTFVGAID